STQAQEAAVKRGQAETKSAASGRAPLQGELTSEKILDMRRRVDETRRKMAEQMLQVFSVVVTQERIGGINVDVVTPREGVADSNRERVLINLHGGGMVFGARWEGQIDSIPIAHTGRFKVITVDYRMAPEHRHPAANEDVARVYAELLKKYRPENIGMYGCSAGAWLTASSVAWFASHGLPRPGAIGLLGAGAVSGTLGDSSYLAGGFFGGIPPYPPQQKQTGFIAQLGKFYWAGVDNKSALVSPAHHPDVLAKFPPTLVLNSTRDPTLSAALYTHRQLNNAGVDSVLHVWDGVDHCFQYEPSLPESRESYQIVARFFDQRLGREAMAAPRADGTVDVPALRTPYSELASEHSRRHFIEFSEGFARLRSLLKPGDSVGTVRQKLDESLMRPGVERLRAAFPVQIDSRTIGAVRTDVVTPVTGVSAKNQERVLINLHGGGFAVGGAYGGQQESIPIASLGRIAVISVDYRMAPEHRFPAASEDVARVYAELLQRYRPENIGIYGCSAGAYLAGQAIAWFQKHGLPPPGAVGLFGGSLIVGQAGDSDMFGAALGGQGARPWQEGEVASNRSLKYFADADLRDPLVSPGLSAQVLRRFPATLLISGTRDLRLSQTVHAHAQLVKQGVDARLHVWEGAPHCAFAQPVVDPNVPEIREAWDVIVRFFDRQLGAAKSSLESSDETTTG
ncbi:MAG TPA: alpha/beta hydrolase, partial [Steroidobacteraceae bacterium]|nr:alpha/beta hydrolase [Steroidobacteraceae bacterium]